MKRVICIVCILVLVISTLTYATYSQRRRTIRERRYTPTHGRLSEFRPDWAQGLTDKEAKEKHKRIWEDAQKNIRQGTYSNRERKVEGVRKKQEQQIQRQRNALALLLRRVERLEVRVKQLEKER